MNNKTFWLDTEYNGHGGELISVALIAEDGSGWYRAVACNDPVLWVRQNVMPVLNTTPVGMQDLQSSLSAFLSKYKHVTIIADWPADIQHFCHLLMLESNPQYKIPTPLITFEYKPYLRGKGKPATPHNALEDARCNMIYDLSLKQPSWLTTLGDFVKRK